MDTRLAHIWLALVLALGQWMPVHAALARATPALPTTAAAASSCCAGECCCAESGGCPCALAPAPAVPHDDRPRAPAPQRDAEQFRAMLAAAALTIAHPATERAPALRIGSDRPAPRAPSVTPQSLHGVWLI